MTEGDWRSRREAEDGRGQQGTGRGGGRKGTAGDGERWKTEGDSRGRGEAGETIADLRAAISSSTVSAVAGWPRRQNIQRRGQSRTELASSLRLCSLRLTGPERGG